MANHVYDAKLITDTGTTLVLELNCPGYPMNTHTATCRIVNTSGWKQLCVTKAETQPGLELVHIANNSLWLNPQTMKASYCGLDDVL